MARNLRPYKVRRFKGLKNWDTVAQTPPDHALECYNVLPSSSGGLEKLRGATILGTPAGGMTGLGSIRQFQNAVGVRQLISAFGTALNSFALDGYMPTLIDTNPLNDAMMDFCQANNLMFLANGLRMMCWDGTLLRKWGIAAPLAAPIAALLEAELADPLVAPTVTSIAAGGGHLPGRDYNVVFTLSGISGETLASPATNVVMAGLEVARVASPPAVLNAIGYNVYADLNGGAGVDYRKVNDTPIAFGTAYVEPDYGWRNPPDAPIVGEMVGGALLLRNYTITFTWVTGAGETIDGPITAVAIAANRLAVVSSPPSAPPGVTGWNCYCDIVGGVARTLQVGGPVALGTALTEPVLGFDALGAASPLLNTAAIGAVDPATNTTGGGLLTLINGRRYRASYGNGIHVGQASAASVLVGPMVNGSIVVFVAAPTDTQCNRIFLFASKDGAEDYYLQLPNPATVDGSWPIATAVGTPAAGPFIGVMVAGALPARNYSAVMTYVTLTGETLPSPFTTAAIALGEIAVVSSPVPAVPGAIGWNLYLDILNGTTYTKQNATPISFADAVTEPMTGFTNTGAAPPVVSTALAGTMVLDETPDDDLNQAVIAPLLNAPPPIGKYLTKFQGRIFVAGIANAVQDVAFSGYDRIFLGRPEESFPPNNRLRLAIGSDEIRGMGALQSGVVFFSKSNEMFMLRGGVQDISTDEPVDYTALLEELPWDMGCASHYSIAKTPYGLVWLASDKTVMLYNGVDQPQSISGGVTPFLRRITPGQEENCRGVFFSFLEREWYLLVCPIDLSTKLNSILIIDLNPDAKDNVGAFPLYGFQCDAIGIVENAGGTSQVVIVNGGACYRLNLLSDTTGGITLEYEATAMELLAYWRSGYFGTDNPELMKFWRFARLVADQPGFRVKLYLVDEDNSSFRFPEIIDFRAVDTPFIPISRKAKYVSVEIQFPMEDIPANVLELIATYIPTSVR